MGAAAEMTGNLLSCPHGSCPEPVLCSEKCVAVNKKYPLWKIHIYAERDAAELKRALEQGLQSYYRR